MIKSDLIHNRKTMKYILYISLIISVILAAASPIKRFKQGKYIQPLHISSLNIEKINSEALNQFNEKINPVIKNGKMSFYDHYIHKLSITSDYNYSVYTPDKLIHYKKSSGAVKYSIEKIIPVNLSIKNLLLDFLIIFTLSTLKYFIIFLLITYLIIERINYSTEIIILKNKLSFTSALTFKDFTLCLFGSIIKTIADIARNKFLFLGMFLIAITNIPLVLSVYFRLDNLNLPLFIIHSIHKLLFDPIFMTFLFAACIKIFRFKLPAIALVTLGIFINLTNAAIYYFGFTVSERNHASLVTPYSILGFLSPQLIALVLLLFISLIPVNYFLIRGLKKVNFNKLAVIVLFLYFVNLPSITYPVISLFYKYSPDKVSIIEHNDDLIYSHQNSLTNFFEELFVLPLFNKPVHMNLSKFKKTADYYNLPFGKRKRGLDITPPERIVMFANESLSLDLISAHNPQITPDNSGIWGIDEIFKKTSTSFYTTSHNTLQGLITGSNSHPNFVLLAEGKEFHFHNSYIKKLSDAGYKTIFLRSASKYFANEDVIFSELGFEEIIAMEDFYDKYPEYIDGWGLMDRFLYKELVNLLDIYRNQKVFILILGVDTHPLDGRKDFKGLDYPFDEKSFSRYKYSEHFLKSVGNMNYDLLNLYRTLKAEGHIDDKTCYIWTADHACPLNSAVADISGYPQTSLARIPLVIDYPMLDHNLYINYLSSQVDLAPTILDIAGIDYPSSYWGNSLFSPDKDDIAVGYDQERIYITTRDVRHVISINKPRNDYERKLVKYFKFVADK